MTNRKGEEGERETDREREREFNLLDFRAGGKFQGVSQERPGGHGA